MGLDGSVQLFDMTVRKYDVEKADRFIPISSIPVYFDNFPPFHLLIHSHFVYLEYFIIYAAGS